MKIIQRKLIEELVTDSANYLSDIIDIENSDAIFDRTCFGKTTNGSNIQHGASGVGIFLKNVPLISNNNLLEDVGEWVFRKIERPENQLEGLYFGISGSLLFLLQIGKMLNKPSYVQLAKKSFLSVPPVHPSIHDITHGTAGIGITNLYFWLETDDDKFLSRAIASADSLIDSFFEIKEGILWKNKADIGSSMSEQVFYGYAHGSAGICHFLLLIYCITKNKKYINIAQGGIDTLIRLVKTKNDCAFWTFGPDNEKIWVHWCNGSSGIGSTLIRMYLICGNKEYLKYSDLAANSVMDNKFNSPLVQCHGLAGNGEFLLDLYNFTGDQKYLDMLNEILEILIFNRVQRGEFLLFPNETHMNISADYGSGLSGIASFLNRALLNFNRPLMLDEILIKEIGMKCLNENK